MSHLNKIVRRVLIEAIDDTQVIRAKGDPAYLATLQRFPAAQQAIDGLIDGFERSKQDRLAYIQNDFPKRLAHLRARMFTRESGILPKKRQLGASALSDQKMQTAMLKRIQSSRIAIPVYPSRIPAQREFKNDEVWSSICDEFAASAGGGASLLAFSPLENPDVFVKSPTLLLDENGRVVGARSPVSNTIVRHELIHQEDHAAAAHLAGNTPSLESSERMESSDDRLPAVLSLGLIDDVLLPPNLLTEDEVAKTAKRSKKISEIMSGSVSDENVSSLITLIGNLLMKLVGRGYLRRVGEKSDAREGSHARVYLHLIKGPIESAAAAGVNDRAALIDGVLAEVGAQYNMQTMSIIALLMAVDMSKVRDLTLVADAGNNSAVG